MDDAEDTPEIAVDEPYDFDAAFAKLRQMREGVRESWAEAEGSGW